MPNLSKYVNISARCGNLFHFDKLSKFGLNGPCAIIIINLCKNEGFTQDSLAKKAFLNKSNIARHLSKLESDGYVLRIPSREDKRALLIYPTEKAKVILPTIKDVFSQWNKILTEDFSEEEKEVLEKLLEKMCEKAKNYTLSKKDE